MKIRPVKIILKKIWNPFKDTWWKHHNDKCNQTTKDDDPPFDIGHEPRENRI
jgi:hypothetical protein